MSRDSVVKQPPSTGSALAYSLVGLVILWIAGSRASQNATLLHPYQEWLGGIAVAMGPGSVLFHGTLTVWGGWFDQMSMYGLLGFMAAYNVVMLRKYPPRLFTALFISAITAAGTAAAILGDASLPVFIATAVAVALFELMVCLMSAHALPFRRSRKLFGVMFLVLLLALVPWLFSSPAVGPPTDTPFHVIWHAMSAAFVGAYYVYLRFQQPV